MSEIPHIFLQVMLVSPNLTENLANTEGTSINTNSDAHIMSSLQESESNYKSVKMRYDGGAQLKNRWNRRVPTKGLPCCHDHTENHLQ